jgi:integrase/recombinase XerD
VALILLLLDTGMRAGEAGRLDVCDVDLVNSEIFIQPYGSSMRKTKSRAIPIGKSTQRALWKYLASRDDPQPDDPFFLGLTGKAIDNHTILQIVRKLGDKAGVKNCHPHRLRHTFAIEYLRNGGDIFTLQKILGHSSLEMVQHYLAVAKTDTTAAHKRASPADRWRL